MQKLHIYRFWEGVVFKRIKWSLHVPTGTRDTSIFIDKRLKYLVSIDFCLPAELV